jgi:hypothetical protein
MEKQKGDTDRWKFNKQRHKDKWKNRKEIQTNANLTYKDIDTDRKIERRYRQMQT